MQGNGVDRRAQSRRADRARTGARPTGTAATAPLSTLSGRSGPAPTTAVTPSPRNPIRRILIVSDVVAASATWALVATVATRADVDGRGEAWRVVAVTAAGIAMAALTRLYRSKVAAVRSVELVRISRAAGVSGLIAYLCGLTGRDGAVFGSCLCFGVWALERSIFAGWLRSARRRRRWLRRILVVGDGAGSLSIARFLHTHPELGYEVCAVAASGVAAADLPPGVPLAGRPEDTLRLALGFGATGVIISSPGLAADLPTRLVRELMLHGLHVHVSSGLSGLTHRRLRSLPLGREPFFYIEPVSLGGAQTAAKRGLDLVLAPLVLLVSLPVLAAAALLIKAEDRGPILFRQERVGRHGRPFTLLKLRTMVPDAEARLDQLRSANERNGPLFKMEDDPRTTRIGRLLRATSIDELPQLLNVLHGTMTLVGPRPALRSEVEQFDEQLLDRLSVTPGITGLWQIEARDDPSFESYRVYDLLYVDNWSLSLDLAIVFSTVTAVVGRALRSWARWRRAEAGSPAAGPAVPGAATGSPAAGPAALGAVTVAPFVAVGSAATGPTVALPALAGDVTAS